MLVSACSFDKGEIFVVHNDMGDGWLWVTSQSTALSGIINQELVVEQVSTVRPSVRPSVNSFLLSPPRHAKYFILCYPLIIFSSSFGFSRQGSSQRISNIHSVLSSASSSVTSTTAMSSLTASIYLLLRLPRFLFPGSSILSILLQIYPSSFPRTCPYHLSFASRIFSPNRPTCAVPLMHSFLILSILVTPKENPNILNYATSISTSCVSID